MINKKSLAKVISKVRQSKSFLYTLPPFRNRIKIGMALLARDEADIIECTVRFHLPKVDLMVVMDNNSVDGTTEILEGLSRKHRDKIILLHKRTDTYDQSSWFTEMVRICARKGCSWIVPCDADEFWTGDIRKEIRDAAQKGCNCIRVPVHLYCPTVDDDLSNSCPVSRMRYRKAEDIWISSKVIHRSHRFTRSVRGSHNANFKGGKTRETKAQNVVCAHYKFRHEEVFCEKYIKKGKIFCDRYRNSAEQGHQWVQYYNLYLEKGRDALVKEYRDHVLVGKAGMACLVKDDSVWEEFEEIPTRS